MEPLPETWAEFFPLVAAKPAPLYRKVEEILTNEDLYEPQDLLSINAQEFLSTLKGRPNVTAGCLAFIKMALERAMHERVPEVTMTSLPQSAMGTMPAGSMLASLAPGAPANLTTPPLAGSALQPLAGAVAPAASASSGPPAAAATPLAETPLRPAAGGPAPEPSHVASIILPGSEDPAAMMLRGGLELNWAASTGQSMTVKRFREVKMRRAVDTSLTLPTLYLQFLDARFMPTKGQFDPQLRAGSDNAEVMVQLPAAMAELPMRIGGSGDLHAALVLVMRFLQGQGEVPVSAPQQKAGGNWGPQQNFSGAVSSGTLYFSLKASRPKAPVNLDKAAFGIPETASLYLFAENHVSVRHMVDEEQRSFELCIAELPAYEGDLAVFANFLKVFYEGGFAYNFKRSANNSIYVPENVGIAALGLRPAFEGQAGISTGYPFLMEPRFLRFVDTVPVSIRTIAEMSPRHGRYGLCFTRMIFVWEGESFSTDGRLDFCSVLPYGGFFYVPGHMQTHASLGGFIYAFGDAREPMEEVDPSLVAAAGGPTSGVPVASPPEEDPNRRVCVVCLDADAIMALVPCGHRAYCAQCLALARNRPCPVCRAQVQSSVRVF